MCGGRRRQARLSENGSYGVRDRLSDRRADRGGLISGLVGMATSATSQQSQHPERGFEAGVTDRDLPPRAATKYPEVRHEAPISAGGLPTYEESTGVPRQLQPPTDINPGTYSSTPATVQTTLTPAEMQLVNEFRSRLNGTSQNSGWEREAERAAQDLERERYDYEIERRSLARGRRSPDDAERDQVRRSQGLLRNLLNQAISEVSSRRSR